MSAAFLDILIALHYLGSTLSYNAVVAGARNINTLGTWDNNSEALVTIEPSYQD